MKHNVQVTAILLLFFFFAQILGLGLLAYEAHPYYITSTQTEIRYDKTALGERPEFSVAYGPVLYLLLGVGLGTVLLLRIMRLHRAIQIWKYWYFLAVTLTLTVSLGVFLPSLLALVLASFLAYKKVSYYNFWLHNGTELFMYAGIALLFAPLFSVFWAAALLFFISLYDMYAVWKSKHMVKLAKFTKESKLFAGLLVNYAQKKSETTVLTTSKDMDAVLSQKPQKSTRYNSALLGGGDILFPLLFSGAVFSEFLRLFYAKSVAFFAALTIVSTAAISLYLLFYLAKKDHFYPAMPVLTLGCFVGYLLLQLILFL